MQKHTLLPVICCALVLAAVGADYGLGQMDVPKPHRLPVESFPAQIGDWRAGPVQAVDPDIQRALATAKIVERPYLNSLGQQVDLMLLTATEDEDMHSPKACFPSQGWVLTNVHDIGMDGQPATQMTAQFEGGPRPNGLVLADRLLSARAAPECPAAKGDRLAHSCDGRAQQYVVVCPYYRAGYAARQSGSGRVCTGFAWANSDSRRPRRRSRPRKS